MFVTMTSFQALGTKVRQIEMGMRDPNGLLILYNQYVKTFSSIKYINKSLVFS